MKSKLLLPFFAFSFLVALLFNTALAFAQDAPPVVAPDYVSLASAVVAALVVFLSPLITGLFKKLSTFIPKISIPVILALVGMALQFLGTLTPWGGKFSPVVAIALAAVGKWLLSFVQLLQSGEAFEGASKKVLVTLLAVGGLLSTQACASTSGAKKDAMQALVIVRAALDLGQTTLLRTECGKPAAPAPPICVPKDKADQAHVVIAKAAKSAAEATDVALALPPSLDGRITSPQLTRAIAEIWDLVLSIKDFFPSSNIQSKLSGDLTALKSKS